MRNEFSESNNADRSSDVVPGQKKPHPSQIREGPLNCNNSGTPSGTRTPNPLIKSQLLCQLS